LLNGAVHRKILGPFNSLLVHLIHSAIHNKFDIMDH